MTSQNVDLKITAKEFTADESRFIKTPAILEGWKPADIANMEGSPRELWNDPSGNDLQNMRFDKQFKIGKRQFRIKSPAIVLRPMMRSRPFQFALILPNFLIFLLAAISGFFGTNDASVSLATVLTWIVWWTFLLLMIAGISRMWCVICPFGAMGEWAHRFTLWGTGGKRFSLNLEWPKKLKGLWMVNAFFIFFLWMDNVFGFGNSPVLTGYFIVVLVVLDVGIGLLFEKRSFCRYMCPINGFIGLQGLFAGFEMRSKSSEVCKQCRGKWCRTGREDVGGGYGCPMFLYPGGNDTNKYCILCTECLKSCPNNTMRLGIRPPLKDLWAGKSFKFDESFNSMALLGVSSIAPLWLIKLTKPLQEVFIANLGMEQRIADIFAKTVLYLTGLATAILFVMAIMWIVDNKLKFHKTFRFIAFRKAFPFIYFPNVSFESFGKGAKHYVNIYTGALLPLTLMKLIADISDHIVRNGSSVIYVVYNFIADFPRGSPDATGQPVFAPITLNSVEIIFAMQALLLTIGFFSSVFVIYKVVLNWEPQKKFSNFREAKRAGIIMLVLSFAFTMLNLWALSGPATL